MSTDNNQGRWEFDENGNVHYIPSEGQGSPTDGSYRYSYRYNSTQNRQPGGNNIPKDPSRGQRSAKADDGWHWILIVLGFVAFWPVGLFLLVLQILGKWPSSNTLNTEANRAVNAVRNGAVQIRDQAVKARQQSTAAPGNYGQTTAQVQERLAREREENERRRQQAEAARQEAQNKQAEKVRKKQEKRQEEGDRYGLGHIRLFRWIGGIMAGLFGFGFIMTLIEELTYFVSMRYMLSETLPLLALTLIGITLIAVAGGRKRKLKKFQKYLSMIGKRDHIPIDALADAMGVSRRKAEKDLEEMLERDYWEQGYVDAARRMLVLGSALEDVPEPETDQEIPADDNATATLRHIREVNDAIADPLMTEKIDKIEELTGKIFKLLDERPEKSGELRSFMNYYLPQTLKILENYAKLEAQGIEGENITEAKAKIEGMMDKMVDGYETQLDKLFANDVLDISADLKVMEQMMEKDGLAVENELNF